ncbi:hypothetical protein K440DRAFT_611101 [Wilcoxina mikolae CBS 423.85]|nr:hypothetical protein K440DRAFT_611101 [Wilcoxina mikolae CBS 423.85]
MDTDNTTTPAKLPTSTETEKRSADHFECPVEKSESSKKSRLPLWSRLILDFVVLALLWAAYVLVVVVTDREGVLDERKKYWNSAFTVAIPMILGLVTVRSYKVMAAVVRWRVLASLGVNQTEINYILGLDSYQKVTFLGWHWLNEKNYIGSFLCFLWVSLMLMTTAATALLGITQDAKSDGALLWQPGNVNVTLLDNYYFNQTNATEPKFSDLANEQYLAHAYGDESKDLYLNAPLITSIPKESDLEPSYGTVQIYQVDGTAEWKYMFQDWTQVDGESLPFGVLSVISNRSVTVKPTCQEYSLNSWVIGGLDPIRNEIWKPGSDEWSMFGPGAVTFMNPDYDPLVAPPNGTMGSSENLCGGPRCATIGVYVMSTNYHNGTGEFYECNITVSVVSDPENNDHTQEMSDKVARLAAGAIGLDGVVYRPGDKSAGIPLWQFVRYNNDTHWGAEVVNANDAGEVARLVGGFAAGSIANLDARNPRKTDQHGRLVLIGIKIFLKEKGKWLWMIIGLVMGAHLFILIPSVLCISYGVRDGKLSYCDMAKLLHPVCAESDKNKKFKYDKVDGINGKFRPV